MKVKIPAYILVELRNKDELTWSPYIPRHYSINDDRIIDFELGNLPDKIRKKLKIALNKSNTDKKCINAYRYIQRYEKIIADVKNAKISNLNQLPSVMKKYLTEHTKRNWLFSETDDGAHLPFVVTNVTYHPPSRDTFAHVIIHMYYVCPKQNKLAKRNIVLNNQDIKRTLSDIIMRQDYFFETNLGIDNYERDVEEYKKIFYRIGKQYVSGGMANYTGRFYGNRCEATKTAGILHKLVVDENLDGKIPSPFVQSKLFERDEQGDYPNVEAPFHCLVKMYDLEKYANLYAHVSILKEYEYNKEVIKKIILKEENRELLDILMNSEDNLMEDIISGKTGGIIVMCSGVAGVGKTLTAEVYSETMGKPLYKVQSSQLGLTITDVENNLKDALLRADKWNAILLIDEADTYVHERGDDILQNCIVGVFLRVLEYYRGILFMTTNRGTKVDDAILSRCTAHIRYELPNQDELNKIWKILSAQGGIKITDEDIAAIVDKYPVMSGRDVKSTLKLCKKISESKGEKIDVKMVGKIEKFLNYTNKENTALPY